MILDCTNIFFPESFINKFRIKNFCLINIKFNYKNIKFNYNS